MKDKFIRVGGPVDSQRGEISLLASILDITYLGSNSRVSQLNHHF